MNTSAIKTEVDKNGRTRYIIAGMVTTYDAQEAIDLTATGVFKLTCPLTLQAMEPPRFSSRTVMFNDEVSGMPQVRVEQFEVIV